MGSIPGSGRSLAEGNGNPLQYSCLVNPTKEGGWWGNNSLGHKEANMIEATACMLYIIQCIK